MTWRLTHPMNRLLQGDVGSGKTVVAIAGMLTRRRGWLSSRVHGADANPGGATLRCLAALARAAGNVRLALRTAARQEESGPLPLFTERQGTRRARKHKSSLERMHCSMRTFHLQILGLVVIDEQHKFGVAQRAQLTAREPAPDVLVMTATPIPRTLTMTIYGDLDVSTINEMPRNREKSSPLCAMSRSSARSLPFCERNWRRPPGLCDLSVDR